MQAFFPRSVFIFLLTHPLFAKIDFVSQSVKFGNVIQGQELTHRFYFKNNSTSQVTIQGVHAACGCTIVNLPEITTYEANKDGYIDTLFKTDNFSGPVAKIITVHTSDKLNPNYTLVLEANIEAEFLVEPPVIDFGKITNGEINKKTVTISKLKNHELSKKEPIFNKNILQVVYHPDLQKEQLEISLNPGYSAGKIKETITVETKSKSLRDIKIPVRAEILGPIQIKPDYIRFGAINRGGNAKAILYLQSTKDFHIIENSYEIFVNGKKAAPESTGDELTLKSGGQIPDKEHNLEFNLKNSGKHPGSVYGKIFLTTDLSEQSVLEVSFYGFFME